jgi:hypothetical protein
MLVHREDVRVARLGGGSHYLSAATAENIDVIREGRTDDHINLTKATRKSMIEQLNAKMPHWHIH